MSILGPSIDRRSMLAGAGTLTLQTAVPAMPRTRSTSEIADLTVTELLRAMRQRKLGCEEVTKAFLARASSLNALNAFITINPEATLRQARSLDARADKTGAFFGVPLAVKDNICVSGWPTTAGTAALKGWQSRSQAEAWTRLAAAGAVVLGKTNMHELAAGGTSNNLIFGPVRNPVDPTRVPGGSSGGTAASVSAKAAPAGLGTDTIGSCRIPAALCGCVGFRPTTGSYPISGVVPLSLSFDTIGPIARSVEDIVLLDAVLRGQSEVPAQPIASIKGSRLGIPRPFWQGIDPAVTASATQFVDRLKSEGADIVDIDLPRDRLGAALGTMFTVMGYEFTRDLAAFLYQEGGPSMPEVLKMARYTSPERPLERYVDPQRYRRSISVDQQALAEMFAIAFEQHKLDALVIPTTPYPALPIGQEMIDVAGRPSPVGLDYTRNTMAVAIAGLPAISVPAPRTAQGLPVGVDLVGRKGRDAALLDLAARLA